MSGMTTLRIRIKMGSNEFEADGPAEIVRAEFASFKRLLGHADPPAQQQQQSEIENVKKISKVDGRIVWLKNPPKHPAQAILALMLGQQLLRNNTKVMGSEIMDGLRKCGYSLTRADRILREHIADANIAATGRHRRRRYRLTERGIGQAQKVVQVVVHALPQES